MVVSPAGDSTKSRILGGALQTGLFAFLFSFMGLIGFLLGSDTSLFAIPNNLLVTFTRTQLERNYPLFPDTCGSSLSQIILDIPLSCKVTDLWPGKIPATACLDLLCAIKPLMWSSSIQRPTKDIWIPIVPDFQYSRHLLIIQVSVL